MKYRISKSAERDLEKNYVYWAERTSPDVAGRVIDKIVDRFWLLAESPETGRACDEIRTGVKCFPAGESLVYYRIARKYTDILRILRVAG